MFWVLVKFYAVLETSTFTEVKLAEYCKKGKLNKPCLCKGLKNLGCQGALQITILALPLDVLYCQVSQKTLFDKGNYYKAWILNILLNELLLQLSLSTLIV